MTPAPSPPIPEDEGEARSLAPIVWLANDEPAFPMLPHPFAFDGIDNDCDGPVDLEDPDEIDDERDYPDLGEYSLMLLEAEDFRRRYADWPRDEVPPSLRLPTQCGRFRAFGYAKGWQMGPVSVYFGPQPRVLFVGERDREGVRGTGKQSPVWNEHRRARPSLWHDDIDPATALIQYWMYYPFDLGPNSHRHDGEHISVFFERSGEVAQPPQVKAVVGAGHEDNSVNNTLVARSRGATPRTNLVLPSALPRHMPILVELGKHASAPDVNCNGRFDLGADANVYSESVWGNRDLWAGSAGKTLKIGRFEPWFSFPRSRERRLLVDGWWNDDLIRGHVQSCDDLTWDTETDRSDARPTTSSDRLEGLPPPQRKAQAARVARTYQLFRLRYLYELYDLLGQDRCKDADECAVILAKFFNDPARKRAYWGDRAPDVVRVDREAAIGMRRWVEESDRVRHIARRDVWKHEAFRNPNSVFRQWLFRRFGIGGDERIEGGNLLAGGVVRVSDFVLKDSRVDLFAHFDRTPEGNNAGQFYDAGFEYFSSRTRFVGSYFGLAYNNQLKTRVAASSGVYLYLANLRWGWFRLPRDLSFSLYSGINGEVFRENKSAGRNATSEGVDKTASKTRPVTRAISKAEALRFQVGVRAVWGFGGPRHPLAR